MSACPPGCSCRPSRRRPHAGDDRRRPRTRPPTPPPRLTNTANCSASSASLPPLRATRPCGDGPSAGHSAVGRWRAPTASVGRWPSGWSVTASRSWMCRPSWPPGYGCCRSDMAARATPTTRSRSRSPPAVSRPRARSASRTRRWVLHLLTKRRQDLVAARTQTINRLHRLLMDLVPGGARRNLTAKRAAALLSEVTPTGAPAVTRWQLATELVPNVRQVESRSPRSRRGSRPRSPGPTPACWGCSGWGRCWRPGSWVRSATSADSPASTTSPPTPAPPHWRPQAARSSATGCHGPGTATVRRDRRAEILATTLTPPPEHLGVTHWSSRLLAAELGISHSTVARV